VAEISFDQALTDMMKASGLAEKRQVLERLGPLFLEKNVDASIARPLRMNHGPPTGQKFTVC
jgi:hypothetical protein